MWQYETWEHKLLRRIEILEMVQVKKKRLRSLFKSALLLL